MIADIDGDDATTAHLAFIADGCGVEGECDEYADTCPLQDWLQKMQTCQP